MFQGLKGLGFRGLGSLLLGFRVRVIGGLGGLSVFYMTSKPKTLKP